MKILDYSMMKLILIEIVHQSMMFSLMMIMMLIMTLTMIVMTNVDIINDVLIDQLEVEWKENIKSIL